MTALKWCGGLAVAAFITYGFVAATAEGGLVDGLILTLFNLGLLYLAITGWRWLRRIQRG
jgi:hypothetical protein